MASLPSVNTKQITNIDAFSILDVYFKDSSILYRQHYESFDELIKYIIPNEIQNNDNILFVKKDIENLMTTIYKLVITNTMLQHPTNENNNKTIIFPQDARLNFLTYSSRLIVDVQQIKQQHNLITGQIT